MEKMAVKEDRRREKLATAHHYIDVVDYRQE